MVRRIMSQPFQARWGVGNGQGWEEQAHNSSHNNRGGSSWSKMGWVRHGKVLQACPPVQAAACHGCVLLARHPMSSCLPKQA